MLANRKETYSTIQVWFLCVPQSYYMVSSDIGTFHLVLVCKQEQWEEPVGDAGGEQELPWTATYKEAAHSVSGNFNQ